MVFFFGLCQDEDLFDVIPLITGGSGVVYGIGYNYQGLHIDYHATFFSSQATILIRAPSEVPTVFSFSLSFDGVKAETPATANNDVESATSISNSITATSGSWVFSVLGLRNNDSAVCPSGFTILSKVRLKDGVFYVACKQDVSSGSHSANWSWNTSAAALTFLVSVKPETTITMDALSNSSLLKCCTVDPDSIEVVVNNHNISYMDKL